MENYTLKETFSSLDAFLSEPTSQAID